MWIASDQLNDVDRELQREPKQRAADAGTDAAIPAAQTVAMAAPRQGNYVRRTRFGERKLHLGPDLADRKDLHRLRRIADDGLRRAHVHGVGLLRSRTRRPNAASGTQKPT